MTADFGNIVAKTDEKRKYVMNSAVVNGTNLNIHSEITPHLKSKEQALIEKLEADEDYDSNEAKIEALENLDHERISVDLKNFDETGTAFPKRALIILTVTQIFNTIILFIHVTNVAK